jgi:hypothetical protein
VKRTSELMAEVYKRVQKFAYMATYPKWSQVGLESWCERICFMMQDQPHLFDKQHPNGWSALETLDVVIDEALNTCETFPSVAEIREIYKAHKFTSNPEPIPQDLIDEARWLFEHPGKDLYDYCRYKETLRPN